MPQSHPDYNSGGGGQKNSRSSTTGRMIFWLIMLFLVAPICGFPAGMLGPTLFPPLANLAAPLACSHGTLQAQPASASTSYSIAFRTRIWCVDSVTAVRNDVSTPVLYISGLVFMIVVFIVLILIMALTEGIRYLGAR